MGIETITIGDRISIKPHVKSIRYIGVSVQFNQPVEAKVCNIDKEYALVEIPGENPGFYKYKLDDLEK